MTITWKCSGAPKSCSIEVCWLKETIIVAAANSHLIHLKFSAENASHPRGLVKGEIAFTPELERLSLERLVYPGGVVKSVQLFPTKPPAGQ